MYFFFLLSLGLLCWPFKSLLCNCRSFDTLLLFRCHCLMLWMFLRQLLLLYPVSFGKLWCCWLHFLTLVCVSVKTRTLLLCILHIETGPLAWTQVLTVQVYLTSQFALEIPWLCLQSTRIMSAYNAKGRLYFTHVLGIQTLVLTLMSRRPSHQAISPALF